MHFGQICITTGMDTVRCHLVCYPVLVGNSFHPAGFQEGEMNTMVV